MCTNMKQSGVCAWRAIPNPGHVGEHRFLYIFHWNVDSLELRMTGDNVDLFQQSDDAGRKRH